MVTMPDGVKFDMQWKQVKYINGKHSIIFEIVPMLTGSDLIIFPDAHHWSNIQGIFSDQERKEIIFLLERIGWKRNLRVVEVNVIPMVDKDSVAVSGAIESTNGYQKLAVENLFDPNSPLNKSEVKEIYCMLEKRFAQCAKGTISIPNDMAFKGSVLAEVSIPALKENGDVVLQLV